MSWQQGQSEEMDSGRRGEWSEYISEGHRHGWMHHGAGDECAHEHERARQHAHEHLHQHEQVYFQQGRGGHSKGHGRGHGQGHGGGPFGAGPGHMPFGEGGEFGFFGPRGRARRGEVRYVLLDALRDGPKHGYEIVKALEERTSGQYVPSPGTVYPTLQYLEDEGLVHSDQQAERRVYELTEAGRAELDAHAEEVKEFWERFTASTAAEASRHELSFLHEELEGLNRTIRAGLHEAIASGDQEKIRSVRKAVENCQNEIRRIISRNV